MQKYRVNEISDLLNISRTMVHKRIKTLKNDLSTHIIKEDGMIFFDPEGLEIIRKGIPSLPIETLVEAAPPAAVPFVTTPETVQTAPPVSCSDDRKEDNHAIDETFVGKEESLREEIVPPVEISPEAVKHAPIPAGLSLMSCPGSLITKNVPKKMVDNLKYALWLLGSPFRFIRWIWRKVTNPNTAVASVKHAILTCSPATAVLNDQDLEQA
ncbi:MAG: HTH domain-containing protein [Candidatus Ozemobacteraceae bacterium]